MSLNNPNLVPQTRAARPWRTSWRFRGHLLLLVGQGRLHQAAAAHPDRGGMIIRAKSPNKDYDPSDISEEMAFEVFGKVLTVWKSEQV